VLEPAALGKPVVVGPHTFNFEEIMERLAEAGGAVTVDDADGLARTVSALFADDARRHRMGEAGRALIESGRGAVARTLEIVDDLLAENRRPE
jgi:3-deoxy-D-manno-octulosonic-acid transferase